ncbi:MAG: acetyltransferase [Nitrospina sp.]|nr:acetyltransferase [Nitrospina sp.]MBT6601993.1 acetyltransferase [Nitrospina sp.]
MKSSMINQFPKEIIFFGGTGQAKVVRPIIEHYGSKLIAVFDDTPNLEKPFHDIPLYLGSQLKEWIQNKKKTELGFCVTIGNPHGRLRIKLHDKLENEGLIPITLAHPTAFISPNAKIGVGSQIMAGSIIGSEVELGQDCIVNTNASVDHESFLGSGVEIAPGATLCGLVNVGINGWVGAGATILPRIQIGSDATIGAGAIVTKNVERGQTVIGNPARPLKSTGAKK